MSNNTPVSLKIQTQTAEERRKRKAEKRGKLNKKISVLMTTWFRKWLIFVKAILISKL